MGLPGLITARRLVRLDLLGLMRIGTGAIGLVLMEISTESV